MAGTDKVQKGKKFKICSFWCKIILSSLFHRRSLMSKTKAASDVLQPSPAPGPQFSAKTLVPEPGKLIFRRKRLIEEVDHFLGKGHLWISGPPGTGKTVLAAQYAKQSSMQAAWYELDELDTELVSFFFLLSQSLCIHDS